METHDGHDEQKPVANTAIESTAAVDGIQHHSHERRRSAVNRLARIEGHVHAVKRMVEDETPCPDVLVQIAAIRSALDNVGRIILEDHIRGCMVDAVKTGDFEQSWLDLEQSLERFIG